MRSPRTGLMQSLPFAYKFLLMNVWDSCISQGQSRGDADDAIWLGGLTKQL